MEENTQLNETSLIEKYSFEYDINETKQIHQEQLKPSINTLITYIIYIAVTIAFKFLFNFSNTLFGILLGIFVICVIVYLRVIILFHKSAKASLVTMPMREYVYSFLMKR